MLVYWQRLHLFAQIQIHQEGRDENQHLQIWRNSFYPEDVGLPTLVSFLPNQSKVK